MSLGGFPSTLSVNRYDCLLNLQPDTVPQGVVDMNKCTDVQDAEALTSHQFSLSVTTPATTLYVKGNSKEEIQW